MDLVRAADIGGTVSSFISGLDLSEAFFAEVLRPLLASAFPQLEYSCGLLGSGSEVLGFDDEMSTDHHWGPRAMLFLLDADYESMSRRITTVLSQKLPHSFRGYPTNFTPPDLNDNGTQMLQLKESGPINHRVEIFTIQGFFKDYIGFDIAKDLTPYDWLAIPQQKLRSVTTGRIFHDDLRLAEARSRFSYYPRNVWLYLLAAAWKRIEEAEHLVGRSGYVGDELGATIIASCIVRDIMRVCFLMEKQYIPYPKWFGTAFNELESAADLAPLLALTLTAHDWKDRQGYLCSSYEVLATKFNERGIVDMLPTKPEQFFNRPFLVLSKGRFSQALIKKIDDPAVKKLLDKPLIGSIDIFSDSTDLLTYPTLFSALVHLYE